MTRPRAIETRYRGFRFRSRLEARWAIYLDQLGVPWDYEREGFDLGSRWHLPDFWLPQQRAWLEIKPREALDTPDATATAALLAAQQDADAFVVYGDPADYVAHWFVPSGHRAPPVQWQACPVCDAWGLVCDLVDLPCACVRRAWYAAYAANEHAAATARGARFEHGERPPLR